jgi:hypothetical protein
MVRLCRESVHAAQAGLRTGAGAAAPKAQGKRAGACTGKIRARIDAVPPLFRARL